MSETRYTEQEAHEAFARGANGEVWGLLGKPDRSQAESELMIHAAHASNYHWLKVGTALHHQRGEWLIARVYAELGMGQAALRHARRCEELTTAHSEMMEDFDRAYAYESLARACAVSGQREKAQEYIKLAQEAGQGIEDEENRSLFLGDLQDGNWGDVV